MYSAKKGETILSIIPWILPALAVLLFVWCAGVCVAGTLRPATLRPLPPGDIGPRWKWRHAAAVCLLIALAWQAVFWTAALMRYPDLDPLAALQAQYYGNTDARHYIDLAQYGYGTGEAFPEQYLMIVFFPLFPALLRLLNPLGVLDWGVLALAVQVPLFAAAGANLYLVLAGRFGHHRALWALAFTAVGPGSLFFFAPMTESLFLLLSTAYVLLLERQHWALCGLVGLLAALTRAPGGLLCGLALIWLIGRACCHMHAPGPGAVLAVAGPPAGLGIYFALNWAVYGNPTQYAFYQKDHWGQALGLFPNTVAYHLRYMAQWWTSNRTAALYLCGAAVAAIFLVLGLLALTARRLPPQYLGYALAYFALTAGTTWAISLPRYFAACFLLPVLPAVIFRKNGLRAAALVLWAMLGVLYTMEFFAQGPIY